MTVQLGVIMDPITSIHPEKDSTFAILLEAQARGWAILYMEQRDLSVDNAIVIAEMHHLRVYDDQKHWFDFGSLQRRALYDLDVILMRKNPPVDNAYIYTTQLLDLVEQRGVPIVNKPQSLRDFNEKLFIFWFPQCCVPTRVTADIAELREFLDSHGDIICKPLSEMGGASIFRLQRGDQNQNVVFEILTQRGTRLAMVQRYIPEIEQGDKRILLINGEPVPYALARIPAPGETRGNLAAGGYGVGVPLTERDRWICEQVGPVLKQKGLLLVGLDVIGDYLTEINITSPTCIRELDKLYSLNISATFLDCIENL